MRSLTVLQPFAHLIVWPDSAVDPRIRAGYGPGGKRIENRGQESSVRGPVLIHAGSGDAGLKWTRADRPNAFLTKRQLEAMTHTKVAFGAIVGIADIIDDIEIHPPGFKFIDGERNPAVTLANGAVVAWYYANKYPWLVAHHHAFGPWGRVLANVKRIVEPIPYKGAQGFFNVPDDLLVSAQWVPAEL